MNMSSTYLACVLSTVGCLACAFNITQLMIWNGMVFSNRLPPWRMMPCGICWAVVHVATHATKCTWMLTDMLLSLYTSELLGRHLHVRSPTKAWLRTMVF